MAAQEGLSKAATKAGRVAAEGLIGVAATDKTGAHRRGELRDRASLPRNDKFQDVVRKVGAVAAKAGGDLAKLLAMPLPGSAGSVEDHVKDMVATIGENMIGAPHRQRIGGGGRGGRLRAQQGRRRPRQDRRAGRAREQGRGRRSAALDRQLAMHIAAASPAAVTADELDPARIERERAIYTEQATASGKSADIVAKMVEGACARNSISRSCFCSRPSSARAATASRPSTRSCKEAAEKLGAPVKIAKFVRYALGEGIDKKDDDFAAEVAKAAGRWANWPL